MTEQEAMEVLVTLKGTGAINGEEIEAIDVVDDAMLELEQYRAIGTPEECRAAVEKQKEKKPRLCMNEVSGMFVDYADGHGEYKKQMNNWWRCPCCNSVVGQRVIVHGRTHDQRKKKFCEDCGTKVDWSDKNDEC